MKLNAATEMEAITWPEFAGLHPFAPAEESEGFAELITSLERWLVAVTGYDAVSVQPNAGAKAGSPVCWPSGRTWSLQGQADRMSA